MKKLILVIAFLVFSSSVANATLINRGTDSLGNRLIYDDILDITWYDYSNPQNSWQAQMDWANSLSVDFGGMPLSNWRLPDTLPVNGSNYDYTFSYNGSTDRGFNITSPHSELAHLYYIGLGNTGYYNTNGNLTGCEDEIEPYCLTNTGVFQNLKGYYYFSRTEYAPDPNKAWLFGTGDGSQDAGYKVTGLIYGMAVYQGDVAPIPEPTTIALLGIGLVGLAGAVVRRRRKKRAT